MIYDHFTMLPERAFIRVGGRMTYEGGGKSSAPAPNYAPMQAASDHAADLGKQLGDAQLAESQRQYDANMAVTKPVVDAQTSLMNQQQDQGNDYYDYMQKTFRPLEKSMVADAQNEGSVQRQEEQAGQAAADMRAGQAQQTNMIAQQGLRYGWSPEKIAAAQAAQSTTNASAVAGAATTARNNQRNLGWARQLDAAGLGRGLAGASQGAYSTMLNAGNSAVSNQMQPGGALMTGMAQGAGMQQQGVGQQITGLNGILNSQTSYANLIAQQNNASSSGFGQVLGQVAGAALTKYSDRRLKDNIVLVAHGRGSLDGINLYEFNYKDSPNRRYRGVMADEVEKVRPNVVAHDHNGFAFVNYDMLGLKMVEV